MNPILSNNRCCGCTACATVCPRKCISLLNDEKGFLYPEISQEECIHCGLCLKVCPTYNLPEMVTPHFIAAARSRNSDIVKRSSSGGIAWVLTQHILQQNGIVYGAAFTENMLGVKHVRVSSLKDAAQLQGSKYVQSDLSGIFDLVKSDLRQKRKVLFIGTPCQVAGLKKSMGQDQENLFTCDLICHSGPSPKVWREHVEALQRSKGKHLRDYHFRDKEIGWHYNLHRAIFQDGSETVHSYWTQCYKRIFLLGLSAREICYNCPFSSIKRVGDISLGDFWSISQISDSFQDDKGVNTVFVNSEKGKSLWMEITEQIEYEETELIDALQEHLVMPMTRSSSVDAFWKVFFSSGYEEAAVQFAGGKIYLTLRNFVKDFLEKYHLLNMIKRVIKR